MFLLTSQPFCSFVFLSFSLFFIMSVCLNCLFQWLKLINRFMFPLTGQPDNNLFVLLSFCLTIFFVFYLIGVFVCLFQKLKLINQFMFLLTGQPDNNLGSENCILSLCLSVHLPSNPSIFLYLCLYPSLSICLSAVLS